MIRTILLAVVTTGAPGLAQQPKTEAAAVKNFDAVQGGPERLRHGAARDLGRFDGAAATRALCSELLRAESRSYQLTVTEALGKHARQGAVEPLLTLLRQTEAPRLAEAVAEATRKQGAVGIDGLALELPRARDVRARRQAICYALARVDDHVGARDALLADIAAVPNGNQLQPLQGLASWRGDAAVDEARELLASGKNLLVAGTAVQQLADHRHESAYKLALQLSRRLAKDDRGDLYRAVVTGLLCDPGKGATPELWRAAAAADRPFERGLTERWTQALGEAAFFTALVKKACKDKDPAIRAVAARALALSPASQHEEARTALTGLLPDKDIRVVRAACMACAPLDARAALASSLAVGPERHQATRITALVALPRIDGETYESLAEIAPKLKGEALAAWLYALKRRPAAEQSRAEVALQHLDDRDWRVRAAAIDLARSAASKDLVTKLIARLKREKGRLRHDALVALREITGAGFGDAKSWQSWWKEAQADVTIPMKDAPSGGRTRTDPTAAAYWDMPVVSDRITFVVDTSGSMKKPFGTGDSDRLEQAQAQLRAILEKLPKGSKANVIAFSAGAVNMFDDLSSLSSRRLKGAKKFVDALESKGPTNVYAALAAAFSQDEVDTIYLLTDGRPSSGTVADVGAIRGWARLWNAGRMVRLHTIALGNKSDLLKDFATDSGGVYRVAR